MNLKALAKKIFRYNEANAASDFENGKVYIVEEEDLTTMKEEII